MIGLRLPPIIPLFVRRRQGCEISQGTKTEQPHPMTNVYAAALSHAGVPAWIAGYAMSSKFYDELAALDRGIAGRWKARSRGNPKYKLKPKDVEAILDPLLFNNPSETISEKQLKPSQY